MDCIRFLLACCLMMPLHSAHAFSEEFLKRLTQPKPGGILGALKPQPPKIPGINLQLGGHKQFGGSLGIGSFGFGFNLGSQWGITPGKGGVNLPPVDPKPEVPHDPYPKPQVPHDPDLKPHVPKPQYPWEGGNEKPPRPNWEEYEEDDNKHKPKPNPYEEKDKAKLTPYEKEEDAGLPDWSDIGEDREDEDFEKKSERFNEGDLTGTGLIQPRLNRRGGRSVGGGESHVYHVPLLFRSNAKPFQVRVHANPNDLTKD